MFKKPQQMKLRGKNMQWKEEMVERERKMSDRGRERERGMGKRKN